MMSIQPGYLALTHSQMRFASDQADYYDDRLVVKLRPATPDRAMAMSRFAGGGRSSIAAAAGAGMSMLDQLDRGGMIKRITPLDVGASLAAAESRRLGAVAFAFSAAVPSSPQPRAVTGLQIIQTRNDADLTGLQMALGEDPSVEFVARVPKRWLTAVKKKKKKRARKKSIKKAAAKRSPATKRKKTAKKKAPGIAATPPSPLVMWNLQKIRWLEAREAGFNDASSIRVAVLDTGIDLTHPDLPGSDIDYIFDYGTEEASASDVDIVGHGTHVTGTIGALINGDIGIHGICNCRLSQYKIFEDEPQFSGIENGWHVYDYFVDPEAYHLALARCLDDGVNVVNLSIGGFAPPSPAELLLFEDLLNNNVCVVAAMGNEDTFTPSYPAAIDGVIAVGASRPNDDRADFSNKGDHIDLLAPGEDIWSTLPTYPGHTRQYHNPGTGQIITADRETMYDAWPGTSMASPHVAAAAALMLHQDNTLTPAQIRNLVNSTAVKVPAMGGNDFTNLHGHGRLDLLNLAAAVP